MRKIHLDMCIFVAKYTNRERTERAGEGGKQDSHVFHIHIITPNSCILEYHIHWRMMSEMTE